MKRNTARRTILVHATEIGCWIAAAAFFTAYFGAHALGEFERTAAITAFEAAHAAAPTTIMASTTHEAAHPRAGDAIDGARDMSPSSVPLAETSGAIGSSYQPGLARARVETGATGTADAGSKQSMPVALLRIPRMDIEVPVFASTSERNLNRGAGLVEGTAMPGSEGNIAIAAHRDRHFRALKDIAVGDVLELQGREQQRRYRVSDISIVDPTDVSPLWATAEPAVTLVTCYPFHFVGNAPQRFIVRALAEQ